MASCRAPAPPTRPQQRLRARWLDATVRRRGDWRDRRPVVRQDRRAPHGPDDLRDAVRLLVAGHRPREHHRAHAERSAQARRQPLARARRLAAHLDNRRRRRRGRARPEGPRRRRASGPRQLAAPSKPCTGSGWSTNAAYSCSPWCSATASGCSQTRSRRSRSRSSSRKTTSGGATYMALRPIATRGVGEFSVQDGRHATMLA